MPNHFGRVILAVATILAVAAASQAQSPQQARKALHSLPRTAQGHPDLSGLWVRDANAPAQQGNNDSFSDQQPPMTPWAQARYRAVREGVKNPEDQGREDLDPVLWPYCMPPGLPRIYLRPGANTFEIGQTPDRVYMVFEVHTTGRVIYMDGREHLDGAPDMFMGDSIGRWDGDTLFVETTGLNGVMTWLDSMGHPMTDALRMEERLQRTDHGTLEISFLFDDPKAYTRPWTGKKVYDLRPDWQLLEYTHCEERSRREYVKNVLKGDTGP